jgi:hypothetical protein
MAKRVPKLNDENNKAVCSAARKVWCLAPDDAERLSRKLVKIIVHLASTPNSGSWADAKQDLEFLTAEAEELKKIWVGKQPF